MPILSIPRSAFDKLHPNRASSWMQEEVEWFVERSRALIGYIAHQIGSDTDPESANWSVVIEGRDERGEFHVIDSQEHVANQRDAQTFLERRMSELLATGLKVFPRSMGALPR
jgi:hypothetical protein